MAIDVTGMSWDLARGLLNEAHLRYNVIMTHPTRDFFKLEPDCCYVVRQRMVSDELEITLAARLQKEVSRNGL